MSNYSWEIISLSLILNLLKNVKSLDFTKKLASKIAHRLYTSLQETTGVFIMHRKPVWLPSLVRDVSLLVCVHHLTSQFSCNCLALIFVCTVFPGRPWLCILKGCNASKKRGGTAWSQVSVVFCTKGPPMFNNHRSCTFLPRFLPRWPLTGQTGGLPWERGFPCDKGRVRVGEESNQHICSPAPLKDAVWWERNSWR